MKRLALCHPSDTQKYEFSDFVQFRFHKVHKCPVFEYLFKYELKLNLYVNINTKPYFQGRKKTLLNKNKTLPKQGLTGHNPMAHPGVFRYLFCYYTFAIPVRHFHPCPFGGIRVADYKGLRNGHGPAKVWAMLRILATRADVR